MSDGLAQLRTIIASAKVHEVNCAELRAKYSKPSPGRAIVCLSDRVQNDVDRIVAEIKAASDRRARELVVLIDSPGGHSTAGFKISEAIAGFKGKTLGVVVGKCSSAATLVLASCQERIAPATTEMLVHSCGFYQNDSRYPYSPERWTAQTHDRQSAHMLGIDRKIADLYFKATRSSELRDMIFSGADFTVTAVEARRYNLLTKTEPASDYVKPGFYLAAYFRPNKRRANAALASMARSARNAGPGFLALRICGEIGNYKGVRAADIRKQLASAPNANVILAHFNSVGGNVAEAFEIAAAIMEHPATKKKAIINGQCLSAAVVPLLAFDLRIANQNAEVMIHRTEVVPTMRGDKRWTSADLADAAKTAALADDETLDFLASRTGFDREYFAREMKTESSMRLVDALKCGLIHEIAGVTGACSTDWPDRVKAFQGGAVVGLPSHMMTSNYIAACRAALPRFGVTSR
jgi:ATP-dependent protease ClpP protease subunit